MKYLMDADDFLVESLEKEIEFLEMQIMEADDNDEGKEGFFRRILKRLSELLGITKRQKAKAQAEGNKPEVEKLQKKEETIIQKQADQKKAFTKWQKFRRVFVKTHEEDLDDREKKLDKSKKKKARQEELDKRDSDLSQREREHYGEKKKFGSKFIDKVKDKFKGVKG